jgi:pimeloyl-ACP methyl ester carboxylesterase
VTAPLSAWRVAVLLAALAAGTAGCHGDSRDETGTGPTTAVADGSGYATTPCPEDVAVAVVGTVECGTLTVPESRPEAGDPVSGADRTVRLLVVVVTPPGGTDHEDPMLVLGTEMATVPNYAGIVPLAQRTGRTVILLEPRGSAHSVPALACPPAADVVAWTDRTGSGQWRHKVAGLTRDCYGSLTAQGIDVAAYDVEEMAADAADLLVALDPGPVNVITYGSSSRIALELVRGHPGMLRTLVMDSPDFPGTDPRAVAAETTRSGIDQVLAWCAEDATCRGEHPRPAGLLDRALTTLDRNPITVPVETPDGQQTVRLDPGLLVRVARQAMTDGGSAGTWGLPTALPGLLAAVGRRDTGQVSAALSELLGYQGPLCAGYRPKCMPAHRVTEGVANTVLCRDVDPGRGPDEPAASSGFRQAFDLGWWYAVCPDWPVATTHSSAPVTTDVPTLVFVGGLAAPTPERVVRANTAGFTDLSVVVAPTGSHNVIGGGCLTGVRDTWVDDPHVDPSRPACLEQRLDWDPAAAPAQPSPPSATSTSSPSPPAGPVPAQAQGTWMVRLTQDQEREDLESHGFGQYADQLFASEDLGQHVTLAITLGPDSFVWSFLIDGVWHPDWKGVADERDGIITMHESTALISDSYSWSVHDDSLDLDWQSSSAELFRNIPEEAYSRAYLSRPLPNGHCTPADLDACR